MHQAKPNLWLYIGLYIAIYTMLASPILVIALISVILSSGFFFPTIILSGIAAYLVQWIYYKKHQKVFTKTENKKLIIRCAVMMSLLQSLTVFTLVCILFKPSFKQIYESLINISVFMFAFMTFIYYLSTRCGFGWSRKKFMKKQLEDKKRKAQLLKQPSVISEINNATKKPSSSPFIT